MAYRMVYLRIRSGGYNFGWTSDTDQAAFKEESRRSFQELGWALHAGHNGVCDTVTKGDQDLYLHPLSFSGVLDEANIQPCGTQRRWTGRLCGAPLGAETGSAHPHRASSETRLYL